MSAVVVCRDHHHGQPSSESFAPSSMPPQQSKAKPDARKNRHQTNTNQSREWCPVLEATGAAQTPDWSLGRRACSRLMSWVLVSLEHCTYLRIPVSPSLSAKLRQSAWYGVQCSQKRSILCSYIGAPGAYLSTWVPRLPDSTVAILTARINSLLQQSTICFDWSGI